MVSLRYHIVSIGAVFLALALGVVLGSTAISDRLLSGLNSDREQLGQQVAELQARNNALNGRLADGATFAAAVGPQVVAHALEGRTVLLITTATAEPADRDALTALLSSAGARVTGQVQLTKAFTDPDRSNQLIELTTRLLPAGVQLPTTPEVGTLVGSLLGSLLVTSPSAAAPQASPEETAAVLAGLRDGGFIRSGPQVAPGQLVVVLTGGPVTGQRSSAATIAHLVTELDRAGAGAVLAGRAPSAASGSLEVLRAETAGTSVVSTVDHVGTPAGRITTVLALAEQAQGGAGQYGVADNAEAVVPATAG